jgi:chemotaxis protein methyltransferase CheR
MQLPLDGDPRRLMHRMMMEIPNVTLSDTEFRQIRKIVWKTTGISLADTKKALVISRLARRLRELGYHSFHKYVNLLKTDPDEVLSMINRITTNLTRFYREKAQFVQLKEIILPEIVTAVKKKRKNSLRIWSAGCSTGEEVYTILFEVMDFFKDVIPSSIDFKILGTDIDSNVLEKAASGCYRNEELKGLDEPHIKKYFNPISDNQFEIKERFRKYVLFLKLNLVNDEFNFKNKFDIIFCRNVVIYFNKETKQRLYEKFHTVLENPGYFFSGHSENLFLYSQMFRFMGKSIYKKVT